MEDRTIAEAVILIRRGDTTMAVHCPSILLVLEPIINEPDIVPLSPITYYATPTVTGYEVEARGVADRLTIWAGTDPFERDALTDPQGAIDA